MKSTRATVLGIVFLWACGGPEPSPNPDSMSTSGQPGRLVIIGGGLQEENTPVYRAVLDGREGVGPVCIFPTASAEPRASMQSALESFEAVGGPGAAKGIDLTLENPEAAILPGTVEEIRSCGGFYFVGGVQTRIVDVFRPGDGDSPAFDAVVERFEAGAVVSGSSAGAAIMTDPMIGGGSSEGALQEGIRWDEEGEGVVLEKGLGFLENTLVDQHFLARGRWARLLVAVLGRDEYAFGAGIDENTALVVEGDGARVVGESGVVFFDTRGVVREGRGSGASGILVFLIGAGDAVDLATGEVRFQPGKSQFRGSGESGGLSRLDLFEPWGLLHFFSESALISDTAFTYEQGDYRFEFRKGPGYRALSGEGQGVEGTPRGLSAGPFLLAYSKIGGG